MKFWNKQKDLRLRKWTCVQFPTLDVYLGGFSHLPYYGWVTRGPFTRLKHKLQNTPSKGKFYMMILKKEIWFERGEDATWFILSEYEKDQKEM